MPAKPKKSAAAKPKAPPALPDDFTTDAPRQGPIGERTPPTEADLIAADEHKGRPLDSDDDKELEDA